MGLLDFFKGKKKINQNKETPNNRTVRFEGQFVDSNTIAEDKKLLST